MTHRNGLPQLDADLTLTDGGLETTLIFHHGIELPHFAAFPLLDDDGGAMRCAVLRAVPRRRQRAPGSGSCSTRRRGARAPTGGAARLRAAALDRVNRGAVELLEDLRAPSRPSARRS